MDEEKEANRQFLIPFEMRHFPSFSGIRPYYWPPGFIPSPSLSPCFFLNIALCLAFHPSPDLPRDFAFLSPSLRTT